MERGHRRVEQITERNNGMRRERKEKRDGMREETDGAGRPRKKIL